MPIKQVRSAKFLGVYLDEHLTCSDHVKTVIEKISKTCPSVYNAGIRCLYEWNIQSHFLTVLLGKHTSFDAPAPSLTSNGPPSGSVKYTGWENFAIFDRNRRLSRKRYTIGPWLLCITRQPLDQCQFQWPWATLKGVQIFRRTTAITLVRLELEWPTLVRTVTQVGEQERLHVVDWSGRVYPEGVPGIDADQVSFFSGGGEG